MHLWVEDGKVHLKDRTPAGQRRSGDFGIWYRYGTYGNKTPDADPTVFAYHAITIFVIAIIEA